MGTNLEPIFELTEAGGGAWKLLTLPYRIARDEHLTREDIGPTTEGEALVRKEDGTVQKVPVLWEVQPDGTREPWITASALHALNFPNLTSEG